MTHWGCAARSRLGLLYSIRNVSHRSLACGGRAVVEAENNRMLLDSRPLDKYSHNVLRFLFSVCLVLNIPHYFRHREGGGHARDLSNPTLSKHGWNMQAWRDNGRISPKNGVGFPPIPSIVVYCPLFDRYYDAILLHFLALVSCVYFTYFACFEEVCQPWPTRHVFDTRYR